MSDRPLVSVVMANYNGARHLQEAVVSLQAQTLAEWELVLVDDASTDDSLDCARALAQADRRIRVFAQPANAGPAAARNRALDEARGRWIAVADSDDVMVPHRLQRLVERARREDAGLAADNQWICSSALEPQRPFLDAREAAALKRVDLAAFVESGRLYSRRADLGFVKPLIDADLIRRTGARYDESLRIGEDFHFMVALLASGAVLTLEPEPLYLYRKHAGSISHRMSEPVLAAMIAADRASLPRLQHSPGAVAAMKRRIAGLQSWGVHERVMQAAKAGRWVEALGHALRRPHAWPLISRPFRERLARAAAARLPFGAPRGFGSPAKGQI